MIFIFNQYIKIFSFFFSLFANLNFSLNFLACQIFFYENKTFFVLSYGFFEKENWGSFQNINGFIDCMLSVLLLSRLK